MQINCQASEFTLPALVPEVSPTLPLVVVVIQHRPTASARAFLSLWAECRHVTRTQVLEDLVWAGLALSSLTLLALSLRF